MASLPTAVPSSRAPRFYKLLSTLSPNDVGSAIDLLIGRLDHLGGDPDLEDEDDWCVDHPSMMPMDGLPGDPEDAEYTLPEWHTLSNGERLRGAYSGRSARDMFVTGLADDIEDDDDDACGARDDIGTAHSATKKMGWDLSFDDVDKEEDDDPGDPHTEDSFDLQASHVGGAGCPVSDPGGCQHDGREFDDYY